MDGRAMCVLVCELTRYLPPREHRRLRTLARPWHDIVDTMVPTYVVPRIRFLKQLRATTRYLALVVYWTCVRSVTGLTVAELSRTPFWAVDFLGSRATQPTISVMEYSMLARRLTPASPP